ncbi:uncharacterized protein M6B38_267035 [Iris pallida]|uniref:SUN domain-containing protein n=1 Tax=Iris pallida TaxID=29817 RepID=A0AAX6IBM9_IRIPA|nr:uncharacterized protein M6B38_360160 [Iris pallida]KAJ6849825.1 uncharacterized protein M6B38_267035 [Iris pallida]
MQRSRRALLRKRDDSDKKGTRGRKRLYYQVSLSLLILSWGLILLNSLISHGNGYRDEMGSEDVQSYWYEALSILDKVSRSGDLLFSDSTSDQNVQKSPVSVGEPVRQKEEVLVGQNSKTSLSTSEKEETDDENIDSDIKVERETPLKSDRLTRVDPPGLDQFKSRVTAKEKSVSSETGNVIHRLEPGGKEYNYASATKGAKILEYNKEAKGASNILDRDKDKYLRNPCSVEEKFVIIELSEETLVDSIELGNFEHYSSNLKDFELLSSLVYPTDSWVMLGNLTAQNVKHAQRFTLPEPKWARYLKVNLLSHYGSEFYCTLSVVEVFGVDVVERMLEDLIAVESRRLESDEQHKEQLPVQAPINGDNLYRELITEIDNESANKVPKTKKEVAKKTVPDPVLETRQVGRMPGDTVLKILLQKVKSLDINFSVLEKYLEELNGRYAHILKDFDADMANKNILLDKIKSEIKDLQYSNDIFTKDMGELFVWKSLVSSQLDMLARDNTNLRLDFERVGDHWADMENKALVVISISFVFGCLAAAKLFITLLLSVFRRRLSVTFCNVDSAWPFLLLSCSFVAFILLS